MVRSSVGRFVDAFGLFAVSVLAMAVVEAGAAVLLFREDWYMEDGLLKVVVAVDPTLLTAMFVAVVLGAAWVAWRSGWNGSSWNPAPVDRLGRHELESLLRRLRTRVPCGHEDADGVCVDNGCAAFVVDRAFVGEWSRRSDGSLGSRLRAVRRAAVERGSPVESSGK